MEHENRLEFALEATGTGIWTLKSGSRNVELDHRMGLLWGFEGASVVALGDFLANVGDPAHVEAFEAVVGGEGVRPDQDLELRIVQPRTGAERWMALRFRRFKTDEGSEIVGTARDITTSRRHDAQVHMLMREITHRSKNLLAIIQAMARQTVKDSVTAIDFEARFSSRLRGLSFSHELLAAQDWRGASLQDLMRGHMAAVLEQHGDRVVIAGPPLFIRPEAAQNIGLAVNELTSNALRFGALSEPSGRLTIDWSLDQTEAGPSWLHVVWNEYGSRAIEPPRRQGFGHKVMERVVARALDGAVTMTFAPTGLQWSLRIPASHVIGPEEDRLD